MSRGNKLILKQTVLHTVILILILCGYLLSVFPPEAAFTFGLTLFIYLLTIITLKYVLDKKQKIFLTVFYGSILLKLILGAILVISLSEILYFNRFSFILLFFIFYFYFIAIEVYTIIKLEKIVNESR